MMEQEAMMKAKYGGMKPKKPLMPRDQKAYFDSADWAMQKEKGGADGGEPAAEPGPGQMNGVPRKTQFSNLQGPGINHLMPQNAPIAMQQGHLPVRARALIDFGCDFFFLKMYCTDDFFFNAVGSFIDVSCSRLSQSIILTPFRLCHLPGPCSAISLVVSCPPPPP